MVADAPFIKDIPVFSDALEMLKVGETDHPSVKQLKNTLEGLGMIYLFSKLAIIARASGRGYSNVKKFGPEALDPRKATELQALQELDAANVDIVIDKRIRGVKVFGFTTSRNICGSDGT